MTVNKRLSLLILSAIVLAFMVNLAISSFETSIKGLKAPEEVIINESLRATPKTTVACVTKTTTASATTTVTKAPLLMEAAQEKTEEAGRGIKEIQGQLLPLLLNISASLIIAASSFLLLKRILG